MNKNLSLILILLGMLFYLPSCSDDDNNDNEVSEEWKTYQQSLYNKVMKEYASESGVYKMISSVSGMGDIYVRDTDYISNNQKGEFDKNGPEVFSKEDDTAAKSNTYASGDYPIDTDEVKIRYEGWYYTEGEKRIIFDSTEQILNTKTGVWEWANNPTYEGSTGTVGFFTDGFRTLLQNMKVGEEKVVCMPYRLAYGEYGESGENVYIPGYTTLFFAVKLMEIVED